jgi:pilus assembly protein Flp/PilA
MKSMSKFSSALKAFIVDETGLTTVEYAIAGGLVGAAVIAAFQALGITVGGVITYIDGQLALAP